MKLETIVDIIETQGMKLFGGLLVLVIGLFLVHRAVKLLMKSERFNRIEPRLGGFLINLIKLLLYIIVILTAAGVMGIPLTSFVTLLASAGVAVSLAMQGALSNFVGGLTILLLKPFKAGDFVKIGDIEGSVQRIALFYSELNTPDNRRIFLPNSSLTNTAIVNFSCTGTRRMDINFSVSYSTDLTLARNTLLDVIRETRGILDDPAPMVRLSQCGDSGLVFTVRVWCNTADYWDVNYDLIENGKRALDAAGIEIPFPQMDVHMK